MVLLGSVKFEPRHCVQVSPVGDADVRVKKVRLWTDDEILECNVEKVSAHQSG